MELPGATAGLHVPEVCSPRDAPLRGPSSRVSHQLAYESQREDREALALRRARKLRGRLGAFGGVLGPMPGCPRGMWWRTYDRVFNQIVTAERVGARKMLRLLARTDRRRMRRRVG